MTALGMKPGEIAQALGVSKAMIDYTVNGALGKEKLELIRGARDADALDLAEEIKAIGPKAIKRVEEVLDDENASHADALRAAFGLLDRIPETSPAKRIQASSSSMHFTPEDVKKMRDEVFANVADAEVIDD